MKRLVASGAGYGTCGNDYDNCSMAERMLQLVTLIHILSFGTVSTNSTSDGRDIKA